MTVLLTLPIAVAVMTLCKQALRFDGVNTASIATLDASTAKTQLMFSMLMVAGWSLGIGWPDKSFHATERSIHRKIIVLSMGYRTRTFGLRRLFISPVLCPSKTVNNDFVQIFLRKA